MLPSKIPPRLNSCLSLLAPFRCQLVCVLLPIILLPIPLIFRTKEASCGWILLLMGYFWITETLPLAVTALIPVVAFPLLSIDTANAISSTYLSDSNFVFFGSMIIAVAVESSKLHERMALRTLLITGPNPRWLMLGFQMATCFLSMWISNTATTMMMVPIVVAVIKELDLCQRRQSDPDACQTPDDVEDILVLEDVPKHQLNIYKGLLLSICFSATIGGTGTLIGTASNIVLSAYLQKMYGNKSPVNFASFMLYALPQMILLQAICWAWLQYLYVNMKEYDRSHEGLVMRMLRKKYEALGKIRYEEKCILISFGIMLALWLLREPQFIRGWGDLFPEGYVTDGTVAMLVSLMLFILPAENPLSHAATKDLKPGEGVRTIMNWKLMRDKFSWNTLLLLGGGFALAAGVERSGLSDYIGSRLSLLEFFPEFIFVGIASFFTTFLTEFSSNVATSSIFIPMVSSIAKLHGVNPLTYVLPVTFASSYAFMFPSGTPPNAIVFAVKILHVTDMVIGGTVLNLGAFIISQISICTYASWIFDLSSGNSTSIQQF